MADEKYVGIPNTKVDTSSDVVISPYNLDPNAKYTEPKYLTGEEVRKQNLIDGSWKIDVGSIEGDMSKPVEAIATLTSSIEDAILGRVPAKIINETVQNPEGAVAGAVIGTYSYKLGSRATESFAKKLLGKYGSSFIGGATTKLVGVAGGATTAATVLGAVPMILDPSPIAEESDLRLAKFKKYALWGVNEADSSESIEAKEKIYDAGINLKDNKITQEEYDNIVRENRPIIVKAQQEYRKQYPSMAKNRLLTAKEDLENAKKRVAEGKSDTDSLGYYQAVFDETVKRYAYYAKDLEGFNVSADLLKGARYTNDNFADIVLANTSEFVQSKDFLEAVKNAQEGIDSDHWLNKTTQIVGNMIPIIASSALANKRARLGRKQFLQSLINDTDYKTLKFKPVRSRKVSAEIAEKVGMTGTFVQELADYDWENKQKYIEETGDTTLSNYKGGGLSGASHAAVAAQIEFAGGVEPLFTGALRRVMKSSGGKWGTIKSILRQGTTTGGGESFEEVVQGFDKFLNQKISGTTDKTWGEALKEWETDAVYGFFIGDAFGSFVGTYNRTQIVNALTEYGLKPDVAGKVADAMIDQVATLSDPNVDLVRENIQQKVALMYEKADMSPAELQDSIDATTDLELAMIATDAAERGIDIANHPLLNSVVNEIGWFRDGIPEQVADQVAILNEEIAGLRQQLREENAKEQKDLNKIDDLETKIEQFYAKLPKEISDLVETDRQKARQMLAEQSARLQTLQAHRKIVRQVQQRAMNALQRAEESDVQQSLRRLEQESKTEEKKTKEAERKQRTEQRKLRKAIEKVRQNIAKRKVGLPVAETLFEDADLVYKALKDSGFTDQQIAQMAEEDIVKTVAPYNISPITAEQFDLADENARLDDIYPAYDGETIEVDGKERTVYNSDGRRIAKSAEALRNFWRWFGDSKVVDEQGRPLVVYHGTNAKFDVFDPDLIGKWDYGFYGKGFYFTDHKYVAEDYAKSGAFDDGGEPVVMPVYLNLKNPFFMEYTNDNGISDEKRARLQEQGYDGVVAVESRDLRKTGYEKELKKAKSLSVEHWQLKDFEGNVVGRVIPYEYVAWKGNQIKSVDNRGTFSSETPNIYYQPEVYDDLITAKSVQSVINIIRGLPTGKEYRILYDTKNKLWYIADAEKSTHIDMFVKAFEQGNYSEFNNRNEAEQFFNENYLADEQTLLSFLVKKYDTPQDAKQGMEHILGTDEYKYAYLSNNTVIFARYEGDLENMGLSDKSFDIYKVDYDENNNRQVVLVDTAKTNTLFQGRTIKQSKKRGFYSPELRLVSLLQAADPSSLSHESAHDWMQQFFRWYRSGKASESFMQSWGALEKALGISPDDLTVPEKASEAFARAYEAWVMTKTDWDKGLDIDDENRDKIIELFKRYQGYLTDIYEDINNPYFLETWGETGKLKPELQAWFDRVTLQPDLIAAQLATGAITPQEAQARIMTRNVNQVVEAAEDNFTKEEKEEIAAVERMNDTSRYEVKGGNKNSLQNRLSGLARDIDENNIALGRYDTHRDMLEVAKAADEFVRTRRDEALGIINGIMPETEGLYASDLYTALERVARETNDVDLAMELVNSKVAKDLAKEWGQRIAGFRNFTGDGDFDVVSQLKSLDNQFKKDYDEKGKERIKTATNEFVEELEKADSEQDVDSFLDSVKCQ